MIEQVKTLVREHKKLLEAQSKLENRLSSIQPGYYLVDGEVWKVEIDWDRRFNLVFQHKVIQEAQT
jgi:hypothetical protein